MQPRNFTWLRKADLLFVVHSKFLFSFSYNHSEECPSILVLGIGIYEAPLFIVKLANPLCTQDSPVATGFSYVEDESLVVKTDYEAAADLTTLLIGLFNGNETLQKSPLYLFAESYGGKFASALGVTALEAIEAGKLKAQLGGRTSFFQVLCGHLFEEVAPLSRLSVFNTQRPAVSDVFSYCPHTGVALGDSWISPEDFVVCDFSHQDICLFCIMKIAIAAW